MRNASLALLLVLGLAAPASAAWDGAVLKTLEPQSDGSVRVTVVLTDSATGESTVLAPFLLDGASLDVAPLAAAVQARVKLVNGAVTNIKKLQPGMLIDLTPATPPDPVPPPKPSAAQQFFLDAARLCGATAVSKVVPAVAADPAYPALQQLVASEFQPAYLAESGWPLSCGN